MIRAMLSMGAPVGEIAAQPRRGRWSWLEVAAHWLSQQVAILVWVPWALLLGAHLALVATQVPNVPLGDEWFTLPSMLGVEPFNLEFLWRRHNEHRIPVPKLILYACYRYGHFDFRTACYFYVLVLGAISAAAMVVARSLRGRHRLSDAIFPLLLLNWAHEENTLWGFQSQMIASATLSLAVLLYIVRRKTPLGVGRASLASLVVCLIALCGQNGVALVPALSLWIAWSGFEQWRSKGRGAARRAAMIALLALCPLGLVALVFYRLPLPEQTSLWPSFPVALEFLVNGLGAATAPHNTAATQTAVTVFLLMLMAATAILIVTKWRRHPEERFRLVGLTCICLAVTSLALSMGYGRSSGFVPRYSVLAVPFYCAIYLLWELHGRSRWERLASPAMLIACLLLLPKNQKIGYEHARARANAYTEPFVAAVWAKKPLPLLIGDHCGMVWGWKHMFDYMMPELQRRSVGIFGAIAATPEYDRRVLYTANEPATATEVIETGVAVQEQADGTLTITLPQPAYIEVLRLDGEMRTPETDVIRCRMEWRDGRRQQFADNRARSYLLDPNAHGTHNHRSEIREHDIWVTVNALVDEIRITPAQKPGWFFVKSVAALAAKPAKR